jgi:hypothetical protein
MTSGQGAYYTCTTKATMHSVAPTFQLGGYQICSSVLFKRQLRMTVDIPAKLDEFTYSLAKCITQVGHITEAAG